MNKGSQTADMDIATDMVTMILVVITTIMKLDTKKDMKRDTMKDFLKANQRMMMPKGKKTKTMVMKMIGK